MWHYIMAHGHKGGLTAERQPSDAATPTHPPKGPEPRPCHCSLGAAGSGVSSGTFPNVRGPVVQWLDPTSFIMSRTVPQCPRVSHKRGPERISTCVVRSATIATAL